MKTNQDIKQKRQELRKELVKMKKIKEELYPQGYIGETKEQGILKGKLHYSISDLTAQIDALTYVLNEDSYLMDATRRVKEDMEFVNNTHINYHVHISSCNCRCEE